MAVGPVSIASLVMGSMLSESVSPTQDSILYLKLAFTSTFFAGLFQASLGLLRYESYPQTFHTLLTENAKLIFGICNRHVKEYVVLASCWSLVFLV